MFRAATSPFKTALSTQMGQSAATVVAKDSGTPEVAAVEEVWVVMGVLLASSGKRFWASILAAVGVVAALSATAETA
jgi:hypothetical protein